jgi:hypothetical protein
MSGSVTITDTSGSVTVTLPANNQMVIQQSTANSVVSVGAPGPQGIQGPMGDVTAAVTTLVQQAQAAAALATQLTSTFDPVALTVNPQTLGTTDSQNAVISLTGSPSAAQTVYLPKAQRALTVVNNTTGTIHPLTLGMTGGTATVNIPRGSAVPVFCDGSTGVYIVGAMLGDQFAGWKTPLSISTALDATYSGWYTAIIAAGTTQTLPPGSTMQLGASIFLDMTVTGTATIKPSSGDTADFGSTLSMAQYDRYTFTWVGGSTGWETTAYSNFQTPHFSTSVTAPVVKATSRAVVGGGTDNGSTALQVTGSGSFTIAPTWPTPVTTDNSTNGATTAFVQNVIAALVASAPAALNTLKELADAIGDDANFSTTMTNLISTKLALAGGTMSGALSVSFASAYISVNAAAAGQQSRINFTTNGSARWGIGKNSDAESGSNAGSSFLINRYDDTGTLIDTAVAIARATGVMTLTARPTWTGYTPWDSGNFTPANYLPLAGGSMTGATTFTGPITHSTSVTGVSLGANSSLPSVVLSNSSGATDTKLWDIQATTAALQFRTIDDAWSNGVPWLTATRTANAVTALATTVRPTFNGNLAWDAGNLTPANYAPLAGATFTGAVTLNSTAALKGTTTVSGAASFTSATATGFTVRPTFNGNTPWDSGNLTPSNYLPLVGGTLSGNLAIVAASAGAVVNISRVAGQYGTLGFQTAGVNRWNFQVNAEAESGSNAGSTLSLYALSDTGTVLGSVFNVVRATQVMALNQRPTFAGNTPWDSGNLTPANYLPLAGGTLTGKLTVTYASPGITVNAAAAAQQGRLDFYTAGSARWAVVKHSDAESGSNAGSSLIINRYDDTGTLIDTPISIARATGVLTFGAQPVLPATGIKFSDGTTITSANAITGLPLTGGSLTGALTINPNASSTSSWSAINSPTTRVIDTGTGSTGGLAIESYQPIIQFIDRSSSAKNSRLMQNAGVFYFANDPGDNSGTWASPGVQISPDGYMAVGPAVTLSSNVSYYANGVMAGTGTSQYGFYFNGEFNASATTAGYAFLSTPKVNASASTTFTMGTLRGFYANTPVLGSATTLTTYTAFFAADSSVAVSNYGYYSNLAAASGKWNFYASGSALNYFAGRTLHGTNTDDGSTMLQAMAASTGYAIAAIRSGNTPQWIGIGAGAIGTNNNLDSYSSASNAKPIIYNATTDAAFTTPTAGSVGHIWQTLGATRMTLSQAGHLLLNTSTDDGTNLIQANGTIKSLTGGFVFPDNTTQLTSATSGRLINVQVFTASGTYTPTTGAASAIVDAVGGGGGGGGTGGVTSGTNSAASQCGGGGGFVRTRLTTLASTAITIGAGGTSGAAGGGTGGTGGDTKFGTILVANGGAGGTGFGASTNPSNGVGASGGGASGGTIFNVRGQPASATNYSVATNYVIYGVGGCSPYGSGATAGLNGAGVAGSGYGVGGGGNVNTSSSSGFAGGVGTPGIIIIFEYS